MKPIDVLMQVLTTAATVSNPASGVAAIAPVIITILSAGVKIVQAGQMTDAELASLFTATGQHIQSTQNEWDVLNKPAAP